MNHTTQLLATHRSIRKFKDQLISEDLFLELVSSAQKASTSSFMQTYSIIQVKDKAKKASLRAISGQAYVEHNAELVVFIADFYRHHILEQTNNISLAPAYETTEGLIVATVDATLAAQNFVIAAESHGLGTCYIGSLRNDMQKVIDILELPKFTYPLFGIVLGYPDQEVDIKPRLPTNEILHIDHYQNNSETIQKNIKEYDQIIENYYASRSSNIKSDTWSSQMIHKMSVPTREDVDAVIKKQGFLKQ